MNIFSNTDVGQKRKVNQDYIFVSENQIGNLWNLFLVADGMGGHNAGDYASRCTVEILVENIRTSKETSPVTILKDAIEKANSELIQRAIQNPELKGMGTTLVAATFADNYMYVANVGDSRLYMIRDNIRQITKDHSLVAELVRVGEIEENEAKHHPDRNIITRAIGATNEVTVDFFDVPLEKGDIILMCSDGLTNMIEDEEIYNILYKPDTLTVKGERLVWVANENGGNDNISVILIEPGLNEVIGC